MARLLSRAMARTGGRAALWAWLVLVAGGLAQVLAVLSIPSWACALRIVIGVAGACASLGFGVATVAGPLAGLAALRGDGSWLGVRSFGARGRDLAPSVLAWILLLGCANAGAAHVLEPLARGVLRDARVDAAASIELRESVATSMGPWAVSAGPEGGLRFAGEDGGDGIIVGEARLEALSGHAGVLHVALGPGEARRVGENGWTLRFASLTAPVTLGGGARVETAERPTQELLGRELGPYERWILWKRTLLPVSLGLLGFAALPLGARWPAAPVLGVLAAAFWGLLRVSDLASQSAGPAAATCLLLAPCALTALLTWAAWSDR